MVVVVNCFALSSIPVISRSTHRLPTGSCPACPPRLGNEAPPTSSILSGSGGGIGSGSGGGSVGSIGGSGGGRTSSSSGL